MHWEIDSGEDLFALLLMVLVVVGGIVLIVLRKNIRAKVGNYNLSSTSDGIDEHKHEGECPMSIQAEHAKLLADLKNGQDKMMELLEKAVKRINSTDESQGALIAQAAIMQKFVRRELGRVREGDAINGDLDEADEEINRAKQIYRLGREL